MTHLGALRTYLDQHSPRTLGEEPRCTCGASNHVRVEHFRVNGQPTTAVIPEGAFLSAQDLRDAIAGASVEPIAESELAEVFADTELGHMDWFENPFGSNVLFDELLAPYSEIVFCPRMYSGQRGQCFRVPTREFMELTRAVVLPLTSFRRVDDWAV